MPCPMPCPCQNPCQTPGKTISVYPADPTCSRVYRYLNAGTYTVDDAGYLRIFGTDDLLGSTHAPGTWGSVDVDIAMDTPGACSCNDKLLNEPLKVGYTWRPTGADALDAHSPSKAFTEQVAKLRKAIDDHAGQDINITVEITDLKSLGNAIELYRAMSADNEDKDRIGGYILRKADQLGALTEDGMIVLGEHVITSTGDDDEGDCCPAGAK